MIASYTYGPLLALFIIGLFTKVNLRDTWVPLACICGPIVCYLLSINSKVFFGDYQIGLELIILNAFITGVLLLALKKPATN
jgi:hypothetical protein